LAWIEVHQSLPTHRKTLMVADALAVSPVEVLGHVVSLWLWALDNAPEGDVSGVPERVLARAAQWDGDPGEFVTAFIGGTFLDRTADGLLIHNWWDYAGKLIDRRQANAARMRAARATHVPSTLHARAGATVPNSTVQNTTGIPLRGAAHASPRAPIVPAEVGLLHDEAGTPTASTEPGLLDGPVGKGVATPRDVVVQPLKPRQVIYCILRRQWGVVAGEENASQRGELNKAVSNLSHYTAEQIETGCAEYMRRWPDMEFTPSALAKHVHTMLSPNRNNGARASPMQPPTKPPRRSAFDQEVIRAPDG